MKYLKYLRYVIVHKWFVFLACWKRGLYWKGIVHDLSKFRPSEFLPYAEHFHGPKAKKWRDETGYYKPTQTGDDAFDFAWLLHQKVNNHHWQWWILPEDDGGELVLPMSPAARTEMLCDWIGASTAQGHGGIVGVRKWYVKNRAKMRFALDTRSWIEWELYGHELPGVVQNV